MRATTAVRARFAGVSPGPARARSRAAGLLLVALLLAPARRAVAQDEAELVRQGVSLREQGKDAEALEVFREAWNRFKTPRSRAQIGLAEQALGRWVEADADLEGALAVTDDAWISNNRGALEGALQVIRQRLGSLEILCETPGSEVWIDGRSVGRLPLARPLRLTAGTVAVRVQSPGHMAVQRTVEVVAGRLARETFHLMPLDSARAAAPPSVSGRVTEPPPDLRPAPRRGLPRPVFWAVGAATVVAGALTIWSGLDVLSANERYEANPTLDGYNDGSSRERRTNWLGGSTAVLGVSTLVIGLFATDFSSP